MKYSEREIKLINSTLLLVFYSVCALTLASTAVMASSIDRQFETSSNSFATELYQVKNTKVLKILCK